MSVERRIALVNIFGGGNGSVDIEAAAAEICSTYSANREDIIE